MGHWTLQNLEKPVVAKQGFVALFCFWEKTYETEEFSLQFGAQLHIGVHTIFETVFDTDLQQFLQIPYETDCALELGLGRVPNQG